MNYEQFLTEKKKSGITKAAEKKAKEMSAKVPTENPQLPTRLVAKTPRN